MARVNLLPWREELRQEKQKEFLGVLMLVLLLAGVAAFTWHSVVQSNIDNQQQRVKLLEDGIAQLKNDLKAIDKLEKTKQQWLARMDVIQGLQSNRAEVVKIFDQLARAIPDGAFLSGAEQTAGSAISLSGFAESYTRITEFIRQLDNADKFNDPGSLTMEKDETLGEDGKSFEFKVQIVNPATFSKDDGYKGGNG